MLLQSPTENELGKRCKQTSGIKCQYIRVYKKYQILVLISTAPKAAQNLNGAYGTHESRSSKAKGGGELNINLKSYKYSIFLNKKNMLNS